MFGSVHREAMRRALRRPERVGTNVTEHVKGSYLRMLTQQRMVPQKEEELAALVKEMSELVGLDGIGRYQQLSQRVNNLRKEVEYLRSGKQADAFYERARPLLGKRKREADEHSNVHQKREAVAMALMHPHKAVPVYMETDRCNACGTDLREISEEALDVCPNPQCQVTRARLAMATDHRDVDFIAQDTHANLNRCTIAANIDNTQDPDQAYPKSEVFHQYLLQFCKVIPTPPRHVLQVVQRELSQVHVSHPGKVHPTPIGTILRQNNLKQWAWMPHRIALELKRKDHETIPLTDHATVLRMVERYTKLIAAMKDERCPNRRKSQNMRFIAKVFAVQEKQYAFSELFENHKTRSVLRREDRNMRIVCNYIEESELNKEGWSWKFFRSL
jgi:hypothetical protein